MNSSRLLELIEKEAKAISTKLPSRCQWHDPHDQLATPPAEAQSPGKVV